MKTINFIVCAGLFLMTSCNNSGNQVSAEAAIPNNSENPASAEVFVPKTPEELKMELNQQELSNPTHYLIANAKMSENTVKTREAGLFREAEYSTDGYNIEGSIKNSASVARFKDVMITVKFLSKTGTIIEETDYPFYEFYEPNSTTPFSLHVYPPDAMEKFSVSVKNASGG